MENTTISNTTKGKINGHTRHAQTRKAKCAAYLTRSTCTTCRKVFRSPKKRFAHIESRHKSLIGWNEDRASKSAI